MKNIKKITPFIIVMLVLVFVVLLTKQKNIEKTGIDKINSSTDVVSDNEQVDNNVDSLDSVKREIPTNESVLRIISQTEYQRLKNKDIQSEEAIHDIRDEKYFLNKYSQVVRTEDCLNITLKNGVVKNLCDDKDLSTWPAIKYSFAGHIPNFGYWFHVGLYEGSYGLLVDEKTGEEVTTFDERPKVSPNSNRFVTTSTDLMAEYNVSGFQVKQKIEDSYVLIAEQVNTKDISFGMSDPVWVNNNSFYFIKKTLDFSQPSNYKKDYGEFSF